MAIRGKEIAEEPPSSSLKRKRDNSGKPISRNCRSTGVLQFFDVAADVDKDGDKRDNSDEDPTEGAGAGAQAESSGWDSRMMLSTGSESSQNPALAWEDRGKSVAENETCGWGLSLELGGILLGTKENSQCSSWGGGNSSANDGRGTIEVTGDWNSQGFAGGNSSASDGGGVQVLVKLVLELVAGIACWNLSSVSKNLIQQKLVVLEMLRVPVGVEETLRQITEVRLKVI
ncbi:hypothetical protein GIB67_018005 [Kingdonia uniflora]|uniref:Uncharacterized protein n=1 Tax=Kingdonia uniflora TaxID=39325 RepID=A0A7J7NW93_9MAGN|nr:hypothetical protein GIB67_018005 [Kingdonia uniflora]